MELPDVLKVPYETVRPFIQSGDLLLCSGTAIFSKLIQAATNSPWSHVGFVLRLDNIERVMVLQSVESVGVNAVPLSSYVSSYGGKDTGYPGRIYLARHTAFVGIDAAQLSHLSQTAVDLLGYPYDVQTILSIAARITAAKLGMAPEPFIRNKAFICSEYTEHCYRSIGIEIAYDSRGFITPADFVKCEAISLLWEIEVQHA